MEHIDGGEFENGAVVRSRMMTALVVDDSMVNQTLHRRLLQKLGIENQVAGNGREAVDVHYSGKIFDLILMDLDMPVMNGIEVYIKLPIIINCLLI